MLREPSAFAGDAPCPVCGWLSGIVPAASEYRGGGILHRGVCRTCDHQWITVFRVLALASRIEPRIESLAAVHQSGGVTAAFEPTGVTHLQVFVRDNNIDQALRILKRKMQREGVFREMKRRRFYEKPSDKASREKGEAVRRARKLARKRAVREGLVAAPRKKQAEPGNVARNRGRASG
jgi:small subunit ribosomal protein S21